MLIFLLIRVWGENWAEGALDQESEQADAIKGSVSQRNLGQPRGVQPDNMLYQFGTALTKRGIIAV